MIGVVGLMADIASSVCLFKGGNCLRQLCFLQFPLLAARSEERDASRLTQPQPAGSNAHA
jgi:hypothetical protein